MAPKCDDDDDVDFSKSLKRYAFLWDDAHGKLELSCHSSYVGPLTLIVALLPRHCV